MKLRKRDGTVVGFDYTKIMAAVEKAFLATLPDNEDGSLAVAADVANAVKEEIDRKYEGQSKENLVIVLEDVQDMVETALAARKPEVARAYIRYRQERTEAREKSGYLMKQYHDIINVASIDSDAQRENANIDADGPMGSMLKIGSTSAKYYYLSNVISPKYARMHRDGWIHIHDMDFYGTTVNCVQIDLKKLFKGGFRTGHGYIREPQDMRSYAALACIAVQSSQNMFFGGQSIPALEYDLDSGFRKEFAKSLAEMEWLASGGYGVDMTAEYRRDFEAFAEGRENVHMAPTIFDSEERLSEDFRNYLLHDCGYTQEVVDGFVRNTGKALKMARKACDQAMEAMVHNLCTMSSRAGAQVPFSSVSFGTGTTLERREVCWSLLHALDSGLGHHETAIFPVSIFRVKEGINYNPGDPNYDLYRYSMKVSAKRLFPNYLFLDAPLNVKGIRKYDTGEYDYDSFAATMGCYDGNQVITYKIGELLFVESGRRAFARISSNRKVLRSGTSEYVDVSEEDVKIYDSSSEGFVQVKKFIRNPVPDNWRIVRFNNGRVVTLTGDHPLPVEGKGRITVDELKVGDRVPGVPMQYSEETVSFNTNLAWLMGLVLCVGRYEDMLTVHLSLSEEEVLARFSSVCWGFGYTFAVTKGDSYRVDVDTKGKGFLLFLEEMFGGLKKADRHIPNEVFSWNRRAKLAFLAGMLDSNGCVHVTTRKKYQICLGSSNEEVALQQMLLFQALGVPAKIYRNSQDQRLRFAVYACVTEEFAEELSGELYSASKKARMTEYPPNKARSVPGKCSVLAVEPYVSEGFAYDVETASDRFDVSGIQSHNCRTRVFSNVNGPEVTASRGNLSFTTINLVRPAIEHKGDFSAYMDALGDIAWDVVGQLLERYKVQRKLKGRNMAFTMENGMYLGSEGVGPDGYIEQAIKNGTLSLGFIGLAEALVLLMGKHHGESEEAQKRGLMIVGLLRKVCDAATAQYGLNFTLIGSPAEGLSGRFTRLDRGRYGVIEGVTDKEWYTNSSHVPVDCKIPASKKIEIEAPYHTLCNAGAITYVEIDGDATKNVEAFGDILSYMHDAGISYGAVNHPDDHDPVCGYHGIINDKCPGCGREATEDEPFVRIRRVTGYLANVETRFNNAKKAEEKHRVKHW